MDIFILKKYFYSYTLRLMDYGCITLPNFNHICWEDCCPLAWLAEFTSLCGTDQE